MSQTSGVRGGVIVRRGRTTYRLLDGAQRHDDERPPAEAGVRREAGALEDEIEEVELREMEFLSRSDDSFYFLDRRTDEQIEIPLEVLGGRHRFLLPNMRLPVELVGGEPVEVRFPQVLELRVAATRPPSSDPRAPGLKPARLENEAELHVPQYVGRGDLIWVDPESGRFLGRAPLGLR